MAHTLVGDILKPIVKSRIAIAVVFFVNGALLGGMAPYFPALKELLRMSDKELGLSLLFSPLGAIVSVPLLGRWIPRFGSRSLTAAAGLALSGLVPLVVFSHSVLAFRGCLFLFGWANAQMDAAMNGQAVMIQDRYPKQMLSSTHGFWSLGGFCGAAGVAFASKLHLPAWEHSTLASILLLAFFACAVPQLLPHLPEEADEAPKLALPTGALLPIALMLILGFAGEGAAWDWAAVYLRSVLHTDQSVAALGFGVFASAMAFARLFGDRPVEWLGNTNTLRVGAVVSSAGMLLAVATPFLSCTLAGFALLGIGMSNVIPVLFRAAGSVPGMSASMGIAGVSTFAYGAFLVAPPVIGLVSDSISLSFALGSAGMLVLLIGVFAKRTLSRTTLANR